MGRRVRRRLNDIAIRAVREPIGRVAVSCLFWLFVIAGLVIFAEPVVWLGFALGAVLPVWLWLAWKGPLMPAAGHLDYFLAMTPREFEEAVANLIVPLGYTEVRVVGGAADLGVDVLCMDRQGRRVAIQCKRYQADNEVSSSQVQTFMGGMVAHEAERGIIVTTSAFSAPARDLAKSQDIRLIDGAELTRMVAQEEGVLEHA